MAEDTRTKFRHADDYLPARVLTEHAEAPPELLEHLATHPYAAVREKVARHPCLRPARHDRGFTRAFVAPGGLQPFHSCRPA